jgi:hypothetical protein
MLLFNFMEPIYPTVFFFSFLLLESFIKEQVEQAFSCRVRKTYPFPFGLTELRVVRNYRSLALPASLDPEAINT